jgi:hypothetical protein
MRGENDVVRIVAMREVLQHDKKSAVDQSTKPLKTSK